MIVQIWEVKRVACYARAETFTEAVTVIVEIFGGFRISPEFLISGGI